MPSPTVEEALAFLQKKSTTNGDSVFAHLTDLIQYIFNAKAEDAVDILETSALLKRTRFLSNSEEKPGSEILGRTPQEERLVETFHKLFNVKTPSNPEEQEEAPEEQEEEPNDENKAEVADFLNESSFFEAVGVGLGPLESYNIALAMNMLASKPGITKVRFFGKFFGTQGNYFIFETNKLGTDEPEDEVEPKLLEFGRPIDTIPKESEGTNAYSYWACNKLGEDFIQLPDVTPLQIKTARMITKFLTGNLEIEVSAYPPFPGVEKNYLRAQIARIAATTILAPNGYFAIEEPEDGDEPSGNMEKNEEWTMPSIDELGTLDAWVHQNPHIKKQGRCLLYVPEPEENEETEEEVEDDEEETPKVDEEPDESPQILSSIDNDVELIDGSRPWSISFSSCIRGLKHKVICLRSLLWPGAYTISTKDGFSNVYVGWAIKNIPYEPTLPPEVQREYEAELFETLELPHVLEPEVPTESEAEHDLQDGEEEDEEEEEGEDE